jgi:type II secretory pathway pseudopilin PulG
MRLRNSLGITLVELLISISILGIFLAVMSSVLSSSQRVTRDQILAADVETSLRLSFLRISEVIKQAAYIYPASQTITLGVGGVGITVTTGEGALAVLLPAGTTYCLPDDTNAQTYCGYLYDVGSRTPYETILGTPSGVTDSVLLERRNTGITWNQSALPPTNWSNVSTGIIADSVNVAVTSLGAVDNLTVNTRKGGIYDMGLFGGTMATSANALIDTVRPQISLSYTGGKSIEVTRAIQIYATAVPRATLPNPD